MKAIKPFLFLTVNCLLLGKAEALPSSARLFNQVYGYKVSCMLCHTDGGGSAPNNYGKAFLRSGANLGSFKKIEARDSDEDGIPNIKEILAKSNPGDKKSLPGSPGDWLKNAGSIFIPEKQLAKVFPSYNKFSAIEGSLNEKQITYLKEALGFDVVDDDRVPTFYFAEKDGKRVAVAQLVSEKGSNDKTLNTGIGVGVDGKVQNVVILGGEIAKSLEGESAFLQSFNGLQLKTLPVAPKEEEKNLLWRSLKRSLALIQAVFSGPKG